MTNYFIFFIFNLIFFNNYSLIANRYNLFDYPDKVRKKHTLPTPLLGGFLIYLNLILYIFMYFFFDSETNYFQTNNEIIIFFLASTFFFIVGYFDDKYHVAPNYKLLLTTVLIVFVMYFDENLIINNINFTFSTSQLNLGLFRYFFTILCFLLFINAYNMLDGINGQASSYAIFILTIFVSLKIELYFLLIPLLFFLILNFKGKMFLGDSGTMLIGFILGYFFVKLHNINKIFISDEIFLIMMIPGFELLRLAFTRIIQKKHPFRPDNNHIHHYLQKKFSFKKTYLIVQGILILPYFLYLLFDNTIVSFIISLILYTFVINIIHEK